MADRPESVPVRVFKNGGPYSTPVLTLSPMNNWSQTITEPRPSSPVPEPEFTVEIDEVPLYELEGIKTSALGDDICITLVHDPVDEEPPLGEAFHVNIPVSVTWDDYNNKDLTRPESVDVTLVRNGVITEMTLSLVDGEPESAWSGVFEFALKTQGDIFTIETSEIPGYTISVTGDDEAGFVVNAKYEVTVDAPVSVVWEDYDNKDATRPDSVEVTLLTDGVPSEMTLSLTDGEPESAWSDIFADLPKYKEDGTAIVYSLESPKIPEYTVSVIGDAETGFVVDAKYEAKQDAPVSVVWEDYDNKDAKRPESVEVTLLIDGVPSEMTLSLTDGEPESAW
ncbi:MAG: Cna B-type domain-containing protein, partial [Eubacteriales bacterium]|nr:Cna B-type domain-containing protein [Eubacteriales bacterium]